MFAVIDTETTGKYNFKLPPEHPSQPKVCEVAVIIADENLRPVNILNTLLRPDNWIIPEEAQQIHGITQEMCHKYGLPIELVKFQVEEMLKSVDSLVAHNADFDTAMLGTWWTETSPIQRFKERTLCTMRLSTTLLNLPGRYGSPKWPTLAEAYKFFTGKELTNAHRALDDALACLEIYRHLNSNNPSEKTQNQAYAFRIAAE